MKGVVFNLLEEVVVKEYGEDTWDDLLASAGLGGSYTSLGSYPDEHITALVMAASQALDKPPADILRWFGTRSMPLLAKSYPDFFTAHASARSFILSLNSIIHPEVRKVYPGAVVPVFDFRNDTDGALLMGYQSPRRLCALAQGFIEGAAAHYNESLTFEHLECMHLGDSRCLCRMMFSVGENH